VQVQREAPGEWRMWKIHCPVVEDLPPWKEAVGVEVVGASTPPRLPEAARPRMSREGRGRGHRWPDPQSPRCEEVGRRQPVGVVKVEEMGWSRGW
jgi:hypothetical protein